MLSLKEFGPLIGTSRSEGGELRELSTSDQKILLQVLIEELEMLHPGEPQKVVAKAFIMGVGIGRQFERRVYAVH